MKNFEKKFILVLILLFLVFLGNFNKALAEEYEKGFLNFLKVKEISRNILEKIKSAVFFEKQDDYKAKYYELLKQLAQLKLAEKESLFLKSVELIKQRYPNSVEAKNLFSQLGIIYASADKQVKEGAIVIDENWVLIGKVRKVYKNNYLEIISLNYPDLQFNIGNLEGKNIGLAKTTGLGYIEVNFVDPQTKIKTGNLLLTAGRDDLFPKDFLVGEVFKIEHLGTSQKIYVVPLGNFESDKFIIVQ